MKTYSEYKQEIRQAIRDREWLNYYGLVGCVKATREAVDMIRELGLDMTGEEPGDMDALGVIAHHGLKALLVMRFPTGSDERMLAGLPAFLSGVHSALQGGKSPSRKSLIRSSVIS